MSVEVDDSEFIQHDFTTASQWEIFNDRLEKVFREWKLPYAEVGESLIKNQLSLCKWHQVVDSIYFADVELRVTRYTAKIDLENKDKTKRDKHSEQRDCQAFIDLMSVENDYSIVDDTQSDIHPIAKWYGLRDFVIVTPVKHSITNESQIRVLLSSLHIAVSESNCEVPVFVQVMEREQNVYLGICEFGSTRLSFDIVHLRTTPPPCKYLSGLLDMFKGKIGIQYNDPVTVTLRLSYSLTKFINSIYISKCKNLFSRFDDEDEDEVELTNFRVLPFGVSADPVEELVLYCSWSEVGENVVIDSQTYSDFDPMLAPLWSIRSHFKMITGYMSETLKSFLCLTENNRNVSDLIFDGIFGGSNTSDGNPLDKLTESKIPSLSSVIPNLTNRRDSKKEKKSEGPIKDEQIMHMLYYMFPDAQLDSPHSYFIPEIEFDPLKIKTAHADSLVHRLSALLAISNLNFGGYKAVAQLWAEFVQELRYRVERCIQIPGVANGFPDSRTCLLHQKLQMLNICMERRRIREGGLPFSLTTDAGRKFSGADSEDEFFDCSDNEDDDGKRHAPWNKPEGRLSRLGKMTLVNSDEPIYIPVTQEPVPKTEDQLEEDAYIMLKLGPGSELGTQMMSASLLSDMESFKAANPNGKLEDFIRWYSPSDWTEDENNENGSGHLSLRMQIPGNTWQTVWQAAKPVPARRQKRLFDDTKEAEKVLHFLESQNIGQITRLTVAVLFHAAILQIQKEIVNEENIIPFLKDKMEKLIMICCKLSRKNWLEIKINPTNYSRNEWESLLNEIKSFECYVIWAKSLKFKLFPNSEEKLNIEEEEILLEMLKGYEAELKNGSKSDLANRILNLFKDAKKAQNEQYGDGEQNVNLSLPNPIERQYTLRVSGKTATKGTGGPQFLRAILKPNEFRLCGAFSEDTNFF